MPETVCDLFSLLKASQCDADDDAGDPYFELEQIASQYDQSGWRSWVEDNLSYRQARNLAINLRRSPELARKLTDLLPEISAQNVQTIQDVTRGGVQATNPLDVFRLAGGILMHPVNSYRSTVNLPQVEAMVQELTSEIVVAGISEKLSEIGETTVPLDAVTTLIGRDGDGFGFDSATPFMFGGTPMRQAMRMIADRFERELAGRTRYNSPTLVVISDGRPTDGDPSEAFDRIKASGVTIVVCFVTDRDILTPKRLVAQASSEWDAAARLMFAGASAVVGKSNLKPLQQHGWTVSAGAKYFVQINHSAILADLLDAMLNYEE